MMEVAGLVLGIIGLLFAFEAPRRFVVGLFYPSSMAKKEIIGANSPIIDLCRRGISVKEIEPNKLYFDIPYCAGKNANAYNVKLQSAVVLKDKAGFKTLSSFNDDFPEGIVLSYETGKSISYTLSPLTASALPFLYIVVRGTYMADGSDKVFQVFDVFKFSAPSNSWVRTLGDEDKSVRAFTLAEV